VVSTFAIFEDLQSKQINKQFPGCFAKKGKSTGSGMQTDLRPTDIVMQSFARLKANLLAYSLREAQFLPLRSNYRN
jgi:hypothetical protein